MVSPQSVTVIIRHLRDLAYKLVKLLHLHVYIYGDRTLIDHKKNEMLSLVALWMDLKDVTLSKIN